MELPFDLNIDSTKNHLPKDGTVHYYGVIFSLESSQKYFKSLMEDILWKNDEAIIMGKKNITKRKVAWYADQPFSYTYSKITKQALPWTALLLELKQKVEEISNTTYNSCLLNLYHDGNEGMAYHSDAEKDLKKDGSIASLSFGADRKFYFKHKLDHEKVEIYLPNGSLLVMKDTTQTHWLHCLPIAKRINSPRINLTFRSIQKI
jgi:alkylated DNA repair dioxygenase AlkB